MAKLMSRCGVFCEECESYGEKCKGCKDSDREFTGKCEVRNCVESQHLEHCGECKSFPCENLEYLSFLDVKSDCGQRIRNCESCSKNSVEE